jgi:ABC-2 type transport system permease protein
MLRVFSYLAYASARNRLGRQLRQLRSPRYAAAFLLGGIYLYFMLLGQRSQRSASSATVASLPLLASLGLAGVVAWSWLFGHERRVLSFTPAEVTFLFSAPVSRRGLIQFKLLRTQLLILFNCLLWTILFSAQGFGPSPPLRALSIWMLLSTIALHRLGASFVRTSLAEHGLSGARHRALSLAVLAAVLAAAAWSAADVLPMIRRGWEDGVLDLLSAIAAAADRPIPRALLWPIRLAVEPLFAPTAAAWLRAAGPAVVLLSLHYIWVVRADTAFEEAAAESALRRAEAVEARGAGGGSMQPGHFSPPLFALKAVGPPATAILWKNVVAVLRTRRARNIGLAVALLGLVVAVVSFDPDGTLAEVVGTLAAMWGAGLVVIGPQWVRNDLRSDLQKLDLLRTYPLRGSEIVAAETAASTAVLSLLQTALLGFAYLAFLGNRSFELSLGDRSLALAAALLLVPAVNFIGLLIHNGAALLYPAWTHLGSGRPGGIEALGQNFLTLIAFVLLLAVALAAPVALGGSVFLLLRDALGLWALLPAVVLADLAIMAESLPAVRWLGGVLERTEVTAAGLERA